MDPRLDRAQGPTIGFAFGHVLTMDALVENGDEAASLSERILALLRLQNSAEKPSFPSMKVPSHRLAQLLVHAAQAGSYTSTCGRQAFADAVWNYCEDEEPHCREFQASLPSSISSSRSVRVVRSRRSSRWPSPWPPATRTAAS